MDKKPVQKKDDISFCKKLFNKNFNGNISSLKETYDWLKESKELSYVADEAYNDFIKEYKTYTINQLVSELKKEKIKTTKDEVYEILEKMNIIYFSESTGKHYGC